MEAQLRTLTEKAAPQCEALAELSASAPAALVRLRQVRSVARTAIERLDSQLRAHAAHVDAIDQRTAEAAAKLAAVEGELGELAEKSTAISTQLASAVEQPGAVLEEVQSQSQQLERVCAAVRKVFAALSHATLEARRQADELRQTGGDAAQQCAQLCQQTSKAGAIIREWVDEAVRTQTRLERTLAECPPLRSTHPGEAMREAGRVLCHQGIEGDDAAMPEADLGFGGDAGQAVEKPPNRSEEIARLIAEASHREADALAGSPA
jgi:chromosome segregation ATPase